MKHDCRLLLFAFHVVPFADSGSHLVRNNPMQLSDTIVGVENYCKQIANALRLNVITASRAMDGVHIAKNIVMNSI